MQYYLLSIGSRIKMLNLYIGMIAMGNKIYKIIGNELLEIDMLFGDMRILRVEHGSHIWFSSTRYVVIKCCNGIMVIDCLGNVRRIVSNMFFDMNQKSAMIIGNQLLLRSNAGSNKLVVIVCDLDLCNFVLWYCIGPYSQILLLPDGKILLSLGVIFDYGTYVEYNNSFSSVFDNLYDCFQYLNLGYMSCVSKVKSFFIVKNTNQIAKINYNYVIDSIIVMNFNLETLYTVNVGDLVMTFDCNKVCVIDNVIYFWNFHYLLIVNEMNVKLIRNEHRVVTCSLKCGVFVNGEFELFRVIQDKLVKYKHVYDFWKDDGIPDWIMNIMNVIMDLELFFDEINNVVYQEIITIYLGPVKN